ncbi:hypothetical protein NPIL_623651 [Nephila pilipes]|uniref:Uncharacterized protein n=1 Tax=Nephila pilipes TaxID=299642 RepID=A0A8X6PP49_NEPPI|nr:hypothetical protein NPIL_623651 [Nephila pilipes]
MHTMGKEFSSFIQMLTDSLCGYIPSVDIFRRSINPGKDFSAFAQIITELPSGESFYLLISSVEERGIPHYLMEILNVLKGRPFNPRIWDSPVPSRSQSTSPPQGLFVPEVPNWSANCIMGQPSNTHSQCVLIDNLGDSQKKKK